jgi:hypothetical protein
MTVELEMMNEENGRLRRHIKCLEAELKNTTPTVPPGVPGGAHTVGEVMTLADDYATEYYGDTQETFEKKRTALLAAITKLVDEHACDRAIMLARIVAMEDAQLEMNPDWDVKSACMQSVREHMEIAVNLRTRLAEVEKDAEKWREYKAGLNAKYGDYVKEKP